jgi:hypothetical protein
MTLVVMLMGIILMVVAITIQLFKKSLDAIAHWMITLGVLLFFMGTNIIKGG